MENNYSQKKKILRFTQNSVKELDIQVIKESSILLMVNGQEWLYLRCSPVDLKELGIGFLYNQGAIQKTEDIKEIKICRDQILDFWLAHQVEKPDFLERPSGCAGGTSYQGQTEKSKPVEKQSVFSSRDIYLLLKKFLQTQKIRKQVRGLHTSALSDAKKIIYHFSDIGRHNTLDKLTGKWLFEKQIIHPMVFLCTGRISAEMLSKCARLRSEMIISLSSPTTQAIEKAEELGITLIGYARSKGFNLYTHPQRIQG